MIISRSSLGSISLLDDPKEYRLSGLVNKMLHETKSLPDDKVEEYIYEEAYVKSENSGIQGALMSNMKNLSNPCEKCNVNP